jgi:WD40-like Beta Propeller Repeat
MRHTCTTSRSRIICGFAFLGSAGGAIPSRRAPGQPVAYYPAGLMMQLWHRRSIKLGLAVLTASVGATLVPAAALGSFPGGNGVVAYSGEHSIWAMDPTTRDELRLTSGFDDSAPSFSPSGNMLAFQRRAGRTITIYLARADGSEPRALVNGSHPAFSSDGRQIVFVRAAGLFLTGLTANSPIQQITRRPGDRAPRWSSTGSIVFQRTDISHVKRHGRITRQVSTELDIIAPPSPHVRTILRYGENTEMWPDWSPNGTTLAVALCNHNASNTKPPFMSFPSFVFHSSCAPDVWAPRGGRVAEPGAGALQGRPETSCPPFIEGGTHEGTTFFAASGSQLYSDQRSPDEISWQPLVAGSSPVPTVKCTPQKRGNEATSEVAPAAVGPGARVCIYSRRRHRTVCVRI